jgi:hypothetical protein
MAEIGIGRDAKLSDGNSFHIQTTLNTDDGSLSTIVYDNNGKTVTSGKPDEVIAYLNKLKTFVKTDTERSDVDVIKTIVQEEVTSQNEKYATLDKSKYASDNKKEETLSKTIAPTSTDALPNDDKDKPPPATTKATTKATTTASAPNKRQYNPLSQFSSSTYKISLYSITPNTLEEFTKTGKWNLSQMLLLVQSGGISDTGSVKRADGFELDFFIDNLEIDTLTNAKETGIAANSFTFKFQIFEPYGMTFPTKLIANQVKIQQLGGTGKTIKSQVEALQGHYLIMLRFYGYDENGKLLTSSNFKGSGNNTDEQAVFERSFPVMIQKFHFKIDGKTTVYDITAKSVSEQVAMGSKRGEINTSFNVVGSTVSEVIGGLGNTTNGLLDKFNQEQQEFVKTKKQEVADIYEVIYEDNSKIKDATLVDQDLNTARAPVVKVDKAGEVNVRTSSNAKSTIVKNQRTMPIGAGTTILQAIDLIITQSSYVTDALTFKDKEQTQPVNEDENIYDENSNPNTISWYIIAPQVTPLKKYDSIRNDFAYRITYVIKKYEIPYVRSTSIKYVPKYPGPHKIYNYWYTGKNAEVLSYEQSYDLLYFNASALSSEATNPNALKSTVPVVPKAAQDAPSVSVASGAFESANTIRTFLYSPKDQLHAKIKILGDPDFLMPSSSGTIGQIMQKWYGEDFTINPNSGQVFMEIIFNQVEDYVNGLLTPNGKIDFWDFKDNSEFQKLTTGMVYMVTRVTSRFSRGVFTQDLKTIIPNFNDLQTPGVENSANKGADTNSGRAGSNATPATSVPVMQADVRRIDNATVTPAVTGRQENNNNSNTGQTNNTTSNQIQPEKKVTFTPNDDQVLPNGKSTNNESTTPVRVGRTQNNGGPMRGRGNFSPPNPTR